MSTALRIALNRLKDARSARQNRWHGRCCADNVRGAAQGLESAQLTYNAVHTWARRMMRQYGIGLRIIDALPGLRVTDNALQAHQDRTIEVSEITRSLQSTAKDLNIPVLAVSQLSCAIETREDKRPRHTDLSDVGPSSRMPRVVVEQMLSAIHTLRYS